MATKKKQSKIDRWWDEHSPYRRAKRALKRKARATRKKVVKKTKLAAFGKCNQCHQPNTPLHRCKSRSIKKKFSELNG